MKISKLFHWLYALVMLLPIFAIGVTCGYAMFNKNAYQSYYGENINQESYENVLVSDYEIGNTYYLINESTNDYYEYVAGNTEFTISNVFVNGVSKDSNILRVYVLESNHNLYLQFMGNDSLIITSENIFNVQFNYYGVNNNLFVNDINNLSYEKVYNYNSFLDNVFYYSVDKVTNSNLFNWAYDSFLVVPFTYIVNLFSMPTNSPIVMLLSYWLAISIIWLVFDLVMYIPLLVHRWLDKGVIE